MRAFIIPLTTIVTWIMSLPASAQAGELRILATGVFEFAVRDLAEPFKRQSGHDVRITIVNAGAAAKKLEAGESYDVILSSSASLDALAAEGMLMPGTKIDIGAMRLGAAVGLDAPPVEVATSSALRSALLAARAVAYIDPHGGGSSGVFFGKLFTQLGVADDVRPKAVLAATGADVVEAVSGGRATLGMTQASELIGAKGVNFVGFLPDDAQLITVYAAAISANAVAPEPAKDFVRLLTGPIGSERLRRSGWSIGTLTK
jgi:molybdate transport system substrate-binding protein